jgi:predicted DNA-binding protein
MRGRKKLEKPKKTVSFYLEEELIERLDVLTVKAGLSRAKMMENMILVGADYLEKMDVVGVLAVARVFEDLRQALKQKESNGCYGKGLASA